MTTAQKLIDLLHGKLHSKHNPFTYAHSLALTASEDDTIHVKQTKDGILRLAFPDHSEAWLIRSGPIWIGEAP